MNKEVSFPIAKLLKEKEIIFETKLYYSSETKVTSVSYNEFAAPTIAEVVMWFYDKHRIWIWVGCRELEDGTNKTIFIPQGRTIPSTKKDGFVVDIIPYTPKGSPTEAYEAAIEHTLNNLI